MVMKLRSYAAIILSSAVLVAQMPAIAQMAPKMAKPKAPEMMPQTEMKMPKGDMPKGDMPKGDMPKEIEAAPATTPIAPAAAPDLMPEMGKPKMPKSEMPQMEKAKPLPTLESVPTQPMTAPSEEMKPSGPVPAAMTMVLPQETITGIKTVSLPEPMPIRPAYFTLPIILKVAQDTGSTSSTPISDRYTGKANWDLAAWMSGVRNCLQQKPKLMRVVGDQSVPFMLNGSEGTIMLNAENHAVCPM
jgi:hypothetical protein